jgi:hypothetical protein
MATWRRGDDAMRYIFVFGIPTPRWLDRSTSRFARRLNLMRVTRSRYVDGKGA